MTFLMMQKRSKFYNLYKDQACIINSNGPSLNKHNFELDVYHNLPTFAVNGFFYKSRETGFCPTYYG